ncbi:MAG: YchF/TatD family DNA exonuclease [Kiritimatiellae bacterium]|nr:YchF/TatD family DNA exonuclease [Kiritimatiellia bacterium]
MMQDSMFIDSHLHFDTFEESGEVADIVYRAEDNGVSQMLAVGGSLLANQTAVELAKKYPHKVFASVGYDRDEAESNPDFDRLNILVTDPGVVAIGETGLDYHYTPDTAQVQLNLFQAMLDIAYAHRLPVIVHSREADQDTLNLLNNQTARWNGKEDEIGVLHCFTGSLDFANALLGMGFMISFSGLLTFKNADSIRAVAQTIPDDRILIETDAPYLAPVPYRGTRNEPAHVVEVAKVLAFIRNCSSERIAAITTDNARRLFHL